MLTENSSFEVNVTRADNVTVHESYDVIDMIESGVTLNQIVQGYYIDGAKKIVMELVF
jgi:hypothetical protein